MTPTYRLAVLAAVFWLGTALHAGAQGLGALTGSDEAAQAAQEALRAAQQAEEPAARAAPRPTAPASFQIRQLRIGPSGLLPASDLQRIVETWQGRRITRAGLGGLLNDIQALYAAREIGLAQAVIAAVDTRSGIVEVTLSEPRIGRLRSQDAAVSDAYLAYRLQVDPAAPLDTRVFAARLERLSLTDDLRLDTVLDRGASADLVDISVGMTGAPARAGLVSLDNFGRMSTGRERLTLAHEWRSLTGWNDPLALSLVMFRGGYNAALSYARVVHPDGARLVVSVDYARTRTLTAPVVTNRAWGLEAGVALPLLLTEQNRLGASLTALSFRESGTTAGVPTLSQRGHGVRLSVTGQAQRTDWVASASASLTAVTWQDRLAGTSDSFRALGLSFAAARRLAPVVLSMQVSGQIANAPAPARLRFSAAGPGAVRGYDATGASDDSGYFIRLQVDAADPVALGASVTARPYAFLDHSRTYARIGGTHVAAASLASAGVGASLQFGRSAQLDIQLVRQLRPAPGATKRRNVLMLAAPLRF
jgi:hemolysin activation/secretion protein